MNQPHRTRARTYVARTRRAIDAEDLGAAEEVARLAIAALDKAAQKGAIHRNNAARRKSRLMRQLHQARSEGQP